MGAVLTAAPYVLNALGGIFGKKRKYIDPAEIARRFGPDAVSADAMKYYNTILNSPYGQQLMSQAATSGQQARSNLASNAAASGMGNGSGATSGASDFAAATAPQIQGSLEQNQKSGIWQQAFQQASQQNQQAAALAERGQNYNNAQPSTFEKIAGAAGQWASALQPGTVQTKKAGEEIGPKVGGDADPTSKFNGRNP
jgi:hypothetical protein